MSSPNYPEQYPTDVTCVWVISVKSSQVIELEFKSLDIEQSNKCKYDSLEILDGSTVIFVARMNEWKKLVCITCHLLKQNMYANNIE